MGEILFSLMECSLLCVALSLDAFFAAFSYGALKIKIPIQSALVIAGVCSGILVGSALLGAVVSPFLDLHLAKLLSFLMLLLLGGVKLFEELFKAIITRFQKKAEGVRFSCFNFQFILKVYANAPEADADLSRRLSPMEAVSLSIALSIDGGLCGLGIGLGGMSLFSLLAVSFLLTLLMVWCGSKIGAKAAKTLKHDFSFLGGVLLILLGITKLF